MTKKEIRNHVHSLLKQDYDTESVLLSGRSAIGRLEQHPLFLKAHCVLLFHSLPDEVDTHGLIQRYYDRKTVLLPTVVGDDIELHVYEGLICQGAFGIRESPGPLFSDYGAIDLAVIPGVAFDLEGNRLGRGRGYYDRFLPFLRCYTIGLCHPFQVIDHVPTEPHDIKVNEVIS